MNCPQHLYTKPNLRHQYETDELDIKLQLLEAPLLQDPSQQPNTHKTAQNSNTGYLRLFVFVVGLCPPALFVGCSPEFYGRKRELCGGRDCSFPLRPIHLAPQPWPSTVKIFTYSSRSTSISKQYVVFAPPRQHIRTVGFGAVNRSMCITLLVSSARCVTETDRPNVLSRRCECGRYCALMDMGRLEYVKKLNVLDSHG
eukprot:scaffold18373_cov24-Cyclotella_meneghiniana.AAC.1